VSAFVQRLNEYMIAVGDNGLMVALDRGFDNSDGAVAWCVDVESVENVGAAVANFVVLDSE